MLKVCLLSSKNDRTFLESFLSFAILHGFPKQFPSVLVTKRNGYYIIVMKTIWWKTDWCTFRHAHCLNKIFKNVINDITLKFQQYVITL